MRTFPAVTIPSLLLFNGVTAQACAVGMAQEINGNWYCSEVTAVTYTDFPGFGFYEKITDMDADSGICSSERYNYSGSLSLLNEELSLHIRGPTWLKQFAVYVPTTIAKEKRSTKSNSHHRRHAAAAVHHHRGHQYLHSRHGKVEEIDEPQLPKRGVGDLVSATIDGVLVSWTNVYAGPGVATDAPVLGAADDTNASTSDTDVTEGADMTSRSSTSAATTTSSPFSMTSTANSQATSEGWTRQAYYNAASGTADGLTFLNHFGGTDGIPGTSAGGPAFGTSLSYASSNGQSGAASPQILSNAMIEDDTEVIIMTDQSCDAGSCGYTRPGGVAYHGFSGAQKVFLLEFSMPLTNSTTFNGDMPAIWLLNAQIPLTSQYGTNAECSCWTSGCGEFDLFEVLDSGNLRCKSTLHMAPAGGSSDWFQRPTGPSITAAVVIAGEHEVAAIRVLGESQSFDRILSEDVVNGWINEQGSVFKMEG
ncbi:MAG: target of Sbf [Alectoria sarmentosa]|nr:MAG: target of Sbf [Alectoria sarmentosa]